MKYQPPVDGAANDPYVDRNLGTGTQGSRVPAAAIEDPQREIVYAITQSGQTPADADLTQLWKAIQRSFSTEKALQNLKQFQNSVRTPMAGTTGSVVAWNGISYTKKSATSLLLVWLTPQMWNSGSTGATVLNLSIGTASVQTLNANNTPTLFVGTPGVIRTISGLGAGAHAISLGFQRFDGASWITVMNPTQATDHAQLPPTSTTTLIIGEIEP